MYKYKYVTIENQELIVKYLPSVDVIPDVIIELAQLRDSKFCYFNHNRWYDFFKYLLDNENPYVNDVFLFQYYASFWFEHFRINKQRRLEGIGTKIGVANLTLPFGVDLVFYDLYGRCLWNYRNVQTQKLLNLYNTYYGLKKSIRQVVNELLRYNNISAIFLLDREFTKDDFADLPKGWKDKLPQLDKLLFSNLEYFKHVQKFNECFVVLSKIKRYVKKYGFLFHQLLNEHLLDLDDEEDIRRKFYNYLNKNNRFLCEPLNITFQLLGKWELVELNTTYKFVEESAVQNHCIGRSNNYISRVKNGHIRAFSFRKTFGESEKRHTIVYARQGNTWLVEQDRSVNNFHKEDVYSSCDLKFLEVNIERLRKELEKKLRKTVEDDLF